MFDDSDFNFSIFTLPLADNINSSIYSEFSILNTRNNVKRTHLFNGRYENIYIEKSSIPTIIPILDFAKTCAQEILNTSDSLYSGYWFNDKPPGSVTIPHTHDDDDELLSGAYYIKVPKNSGDLILTKYVLNKTITTL